MEAYVKEVQLPSKGRVYGDSIPDGMVTIEPMGTREEKLFSGGASQGTKIIDKIFKSCVTCPINVKDLILGDRMYLLTQLRSISYGREYTYAFKCSECGSKSYGTVDLDNLSLIEPRDELGDPSKFVVKLPRLGNELLVRLLTGRDEEKVQRYMKNVASKFRGKGSVGAESVYRAARRIESIDGDPVGIREAMELVESLKGEDSMEFRDVVQEHDIGPDLDVEPTCSNCGYDAEPFPLPFTAEFFRPRRRRTRPGDHIAAAERLDAAESS